MRLKRFLLLLVVHLIPPIALFWTDISNTLEMRKIRSAPVSTVAVSFELGSTESKKYGPSYFVRYKFLATDGKVYQARTTLTDKPGALSYLAAAPTQIVYYSADPSINTLKRYYDLRRNDSLFQLLFIVTLASLAFAVPVSLFWTWFPVWFRKKFK